MVDHFSKIAQKAYKAVVSLSHPTWLFSPPSHNSPCPQQQQKKYIKNGEREEKCSSCGHLCWYLCVDSRVLSIPVLESHGLLITLHSSHTLYLLLPTWTFAIETMIAYIMVLTNKGLVRQHQASHAMRREIVFGILILFINIFSFHRKCCINTTGHGVGKPEFNFFPSQSFILAFISPWYEHFKTNGQFPCF